MTIEIRIEDNDLHIFNEALYIFNEALYDYEIKIRKRIKYNDDMIKEIPEHKKVYDDVNEILETSLMRCSYLQGLVSALSE
jgi:hypothetical protein